MWRPQPHYAEEGVDGLLREKTRKPGKAGTMTHDDVRHGTTTLFAPLDVLDGTVSCSWPNAVEGFFAKLSRRRLKHGAFHSPIDLQAAIDRFIAEHNADPRPFTWTASSASILDKLDQAKASVH